MNLKEIGRAIVFIGYLFFFISGGTIGVRLRFDIVLPMVLIAAFLIAVGYVIFRFATLQEYYSKIIDIGMAIGVGGAFLIIVGIFYLYNNASFLYFFLSWIIGLMLLVIGLIIFIWFATPIPRWLWPKG